MNGNDFSYFLNFVDDDKLKIAYAASVGKKWSKDDIYRVKEFLTRFDAIGVREQDTNLQINKELSIDSVCVPDPTILIKKDEWKKYIYDIDLSNYVLVYFPYEEILAAARRYAKLNKKKLVVIRQGFNLFNRENQMIYSPQEFLSYIYYADAVFTDSYHGILFSMYFNKQFWTNNKGNRILSLLDYLDLKHCLIENDKEFKNIVQYSDVNIKLDKLRNSGINYLNKLFKKES